MINSFRIRSLPLIICLLLFSAPTARSSRAKEQVIKSNSQVISYSINGEIIPGWTITPQLKPDRLSVECLRQNNIVSFFTDLDSITFNVNTGDTIRFTILLNGKYSAMTEIVGVPKNVNFSNSYIKQHKGKFEVAIPEVHELANILVALSTVGRLDSNMIDMTTRYHSEVMEYFSPFVKDPVIDTVNKYITGVFDNNSYLYYYALKMNSCAYAFDNEGNIKNTGIIRKMGFDTPDDPLIIISPLMTDFAKRSGFREFYKNHHDYYESLITTYKQLNPVDKMQKWLEDRFGFSYGNYTVYFSPLVGGAHSTKRFKDNGFEQTFMFVCRAERSLQYSLNLNEMIESRVVFTEIDHNFVNPVTDKKIEQVNSAFANRAKWVKDGNGTDIYNSAYSVFNENMTWAIYSLYCYDNFPKEEVNMFINRMENQMANDRGFINFKDFNQQLIKINRENQGASINTLYDLMLKWCYTHNR